MPNMKQSLAPIVLFAYNRPKHLRLCLETLAENEESAQSELFIFADGAKKDASPEQLQKIKEVRAIANEKQWVGKVYFTESTENKGLANSIIEGVTKIINQYGRVIVLEDDFILGKYFLRYMNEALDKYENEHQIMQISGFQFPLNLLQKNSAFFMPVTTTWGWATWKRVWQQVDFYPTNWDVLLSDKLLAHQFNLRGAYPYTDMFINQMKDNNYGSWGIRFWWVIFKTKGLVLYTDYPMLQHSDDDFSGTHKSDYSNLNTLNWNINYHINSFPTSINAEEESFKKLIAFLKRRTSLLGKIKRKISTILKIR